MKYEVEQKHPVTCFESVETKLAEMGATIGPPREELDLYVNHPLRDFAETDEALRIRQKGGKTLITYKGPKIDNTTKTRRELELPLGDQPETPQRWRELLEVLSFRAVAEVRKIRRMAHVAWNGQTVTLTLDDVDHVGTFVELEIEADEDGVEKAKSQLATLASELGLGSLRTPKLPGTASGNTPRGIRMNKFAACILLLAAITTEAPTISIGTATAPCRKTIARSSGTWSNAFTHPDGGLDSGQHRISSPYGLNCTRPAST